VNVIYPPAQTNVIVTPNSGSSGYDQYGQPLNTGGYASRGSTSDQAVYLIASKDHTIQAALSYAVNGSTLEYTTMDHQQRRMPLDQVDRALTDRLNRERHVSFALPQ
jgi:hypothetical protein